MSMMPPVSAARGFSLDDIPERISRLPWTLILVTCIIMAIGTAMLYSVAPGTATHQGGWSPWAGNQEAPQSTKRTTTPFALARVGLG